jgi:hypothetical protein
VRFYLAILHSEERLLRDRAEVLREEFKMVCALTIESMQIAMLKSATAVDTAQTWGNGVSAVMKHMFILTRMNVPESSAARSDRIEKNPWDAALYMRVGQRA